MPDTAPAAFRQRLARAIAGRPLTLATVSVTVDDAPGWQRQAGGTSLDKDWSQLYAEQTDALLAWRKNPLARAIVRLTTDHVVGDGLTLASTNDTLDHFIRRFWNHPLNQLDMRLPEMCSDLTRNGELFPVLSFAPDGMSYIRFKPAATIDGLTWQAEDYERETSYHEVADSPANSKGRTWLGVDHPDAANAPQVMLHYAINKPIGCTRGESDLAPILPWLRYYSDWLRDRVRLNWATRVFLWFVTVPSNRIAEKTQQYANPPDPGSIIVKDSQETWEMQTPALQAHDASADGKQLRMMIASGAGIPLHMLSEAEGTNLATATAQEGPTMKHFQRRQLLFSHILRDITLRAYEHWRTVNERHTVQATHEMIQVTAPEIVKDDNAPLATASRDLVQMLASLRDQLSAAGWTPGDDLAQRTVELAFRFAGEMLTPDQITGILGTKSAPPPAPAPAPPGNPGGQDAP